jgi:hypothetical protein
MTGRKTNPETTILKTTKLGNIHPGIGNPEITTHRDLLGITTGEKTMPS